VVVAQAQLRAAVPAWRRCWDAILRIGLPAAVLGGVGLWFQWGRFRSPTPSLIDEWFGVTYSRPALHALFAGDYFSSGLDFGGRYRPAYTAVWNYLQWHVPNGPSPTTVALWGMFRIGLFLAAIWILAAWLAGHETRTARSRLWLAPLAVALTPGIADDLARYGPGDPMMVSGLIVGLALIGRGVKRLELGVRSRRDNVFVAAAIGGGYLVYLLGVYSKEASFCLLIFAPFFLIWLGPKARRHLPASTASRVLLVGLVALLVAPLVHMALRLAIGFANGERPYPTPHYSSAWRVYAAVISPLIGAPASLKTWFWFGGVLVAVAVIAIRLNNRQRDGWLLLGVLTTGYFMTSVALTRGEMGSWYYIPWIVAVSAVAVQALLRTNTVVTAGVGALLLLIGLSGTRASLATWTDLEQSGSTAVAVSKSLSGAGCRVYLANFDIERRVAVPLLFPYAQGRQIDRCRSQSPAAYAVSWKDRQLPTTFAARCRTAWRKLRVDDGIATYRCASFRSTAIPNQNAASGTSATKVVRLELSQQLPRPKTLFQRSVNAG
jgi:hypothetical protein